MEKQLHFASGEFNFFRLCFYALFSKLGFKTALPMKVILHGKNKNKNEFCTFGTILFLFSMVVHCVLFIASVVIKINLFSFRLNGLKSNYFRGELSHVSALLAILFFCFYHKRNYTVLLLRANIQFTFVEIKMA